MLRPIFLHLNHQRKCPRCRHRPLLVPPNLNQRIPVILQCMASESFERRILLQWLPAFPLRWASYGPLTRGSESLPGEVIGDGTVTERPAGLSVVPTHWAVRF